MASNNNNSDGELREQIEDNIRCCLCLEMFDDPRMLPCSHTFCFKCLKQLAANNRGKARCPLRDGKEDIKENKIDSLPINRNVRDIVELVKQNKSKTIIEFKGYRK